MKSLILYVVVGLLVGAWLPAEAAAQGQSPAAVDPQPKPAVSNVADYARTLRDPFSPIGHRPPELAAPPIEPTGVPLPSGDLIKRAKDRLGDLKAVIQRGTNYVAYVNGTIVKVGDELSVTVDGVTVTFIVRAISPGKVELEPQK